MPEALVALTETPHIGEAQGVGLVIFGSFAVFHILKVFGDCRSLPPQPLSDLLLGQALEVEVEVDVNSECG